MERNNQELLFDKQWKEYLELERLIQENAVKSEFDKTGMLKGMIYDLCMVAKQMNYSLYERATALFNGATLETLEAVCRVKRNDLDEIANNMNSSMKK